jgi:TetR/AcrR family transcriptional regulator
LKGKKVSGQKRQESINTILDAATAVFAEAGFAGARIDEIARRAGINKAMIYYHIGDKKALYASVLHRVFRKTTVTISDDIRDDRSPEVKLSTYISNMASAMENNPHIPPIMLRELASNGKSFPAIVAEDFSNLLSTLYGILKEGVDKGVFIEVPPLILHLMIVGTFILSRRVDALTEQIGLKGALPAPLLGKETETVSDVIRRLLLNGIRKR